MKQTLKAVGINTSLFSAHSTRHSHSSTTFMEGLSLTDIVKKEGGNQHQHLGNFIMLFSFANTLRRIYVIKKYDNWVYISYTVIMLLNLIYYTWVICRIESGNIFEIKLMQWRLIEIIPLFCEVNQSRVISAHTWATPNKGFQVGLQNAIELQLLHLINLTHRT